MTRRDDDQVIEFHVTKEEAHDYGIDDLIKKAYKDGRRASRWCQTLGDGEFSLEPGAEVEITLYNDGAVSIRIWESNRKRLDGEEK